MRGSSPCMAKLKAQRSCMGVSSANPHGQFNVVGERRGHVAVCGRAHPRKVVGAKIGVVGDDEGARPETALHQAQDFGIERLGAVEQKQIDRFGEIDAQRPQGVSHSDLNEVDETSGRQMIPGPRHLGRLELAGDQAPAAIVPQGRGEVQGRDAEGGPELDNRPRSGASRQHVEQHARLSRDGERKILQAPVEVEIIGLAPHEARLLLGRELGQCSAGLRLSSLFEQAIQQRGQRGGVQGGHVGLRYEVSASLCWTQNTTNYSCLLFALGRRPMTDRPSAHISSRKQPRQARSTELVATILEAAAQVLAREGAQRFTTARVAEKAGVSIGSLYQYFPNKASILFRLQSDEWRQTTELLRVILEDLRRPPLERLRTLVHAFIRSECDEAGMRVALNDAAPLYRDAPEAREARVSGHRTFLVFMREALPETSESTRT